ncbi:MAG TPA: MBL fold metallo-hydrolase [bacterium]|nr:MBL fold metallo-hydrolase [bacterium]
MKITILVDNISKKNNLQAEHGFSAYIEDTHKILFDTGASGLLIENSKELGIDLNKIEFIILSHNHYDHTGDLKNLNNLLNNKINIIAGNNFFIEKYKKINGVYNKISNEFIDKNIFENNYNFFSVNDIYQISQNIFIVSLRNGESILKEYFYIKNNNSEFIPDNFEEEIVLVYKKLNELTVLTGCCHTGIEHICNRLKSNFKNCIVKNIIGGLHLEKVDEAYFEKIIQYVKNNNIKLFPGHCTGELKLWLLQSNIKENVEILEVGKDINF